MTEATPKPICGIVMPISSIDGCSESHWSEVLDIISEAIEDAEFEGNLVSNADDVGIIHKRIIQNLYDNPMVVCDVSGKNPNVMFELGLRLAFDKPTVIVKDDKTTYSFDTSAIEHLEYPRDLRFSSIVAFKQKLAEKIAATYKRATSDSNYTTFLKHFGEFTVAKLDKKEVSGQEYILEELRSMRNEIRRLEYSPSSRGDSSVVRAHKSKAHPEADIDMCMRTASDGRINELMGRAHEHPELLNVQLVEFEGHKHLIATAKPGANLARIEDSLRPRVRYARAVTIPKQADKE